MNKEQKTAVVAELTEELKGSDAIFAIDYRGISVPQAAELRSSLREADARFRVVKNRLTLLAADAAGTDDLKPHLSGPTALALVDGDVALAAKTISKLGGEWELLEFKGGIMDGEALDPDSFTAIARLPGRDQLNAQFAGIVASPLTGLVRGLGSMVQGLASQLQQIADKGLVSGEAPPAEEAPAEAPPAEEAPAEAAAEDAPAEDAPAEEALAEDAATEAEAAPADDAPAEDAPAEDAPADQEQPDEEPDPEPEQPVAEETEPDPEPEQSPEEAPSEEQAPAGEEAGEQVPATGEGDAEPGEAQEGAQDEADAETSEDSEKNKEDD